MFVNIRNTWGDAKQDISDAIEGVQKNLDSAAVLITCPEIIVTTRWSGEDITCVSADGSMIEGEISDNKVVFKLPDYGTYTITGIHDGYTQTQTVDVMVCQQYPISIEYYSDVFSENSWETIIDFCQRNVVPDTWKPGDVKGVQTTDINGVIQASSITMPIMILGKHEDVYEDGIRQAPLTFVTTQYSYGLWDTSIKSNYRMHYDASVGSGSNYSSNAQGWEGCDARKALVGDNYINNNSYIPSYIIDAVKPVLKKTSVGLQSTEIKTTEDKFWFLSVTEYLGNGGDYAADGEGGQYEYFANGNALWGYSSNNLPLRSPDITTTTSYCVLKCGTTAGVNPNGGCSYRVTGVSTLKSNVTFDNGCMPVGFCF